MPPVDSSGRAQEPFQSYLPPCGYFAHRMMGNVDPEQKLIPSRPSFPLPVSQQTLVRNSQGASSSVRLWAPAPPLCSVMHLPRPSSAPPLRPSSPPPPPLKPHLPHAAPSLEVLFPTLPVAGSLPLFFLRACSFSSEEGDFALITI